MPFLRVLMQLYAWLVSIGRIGGSKPEPTAAKPKRECKSKKAKPAKKAGRPKKPAGKPRADCTNKKAEVIAMMNRADGATLPRS